MTTFINTVFISSNLLIRTNLCYILTSYLAKALSLWLRLTANMIGGSIGGTFGGSIGGTIRRLINFLICVMLLLAFVSNIFIYKEFYILSCIPLISVKGHSIAAQKGITTRYFSYKRLTKIERNSFSISPEIHNIIIGLCMGDLYIDRQSINARLKIEQGIIHEAYLLHLYELFKDYCNLGPKINNRKLRSLTGNISNSIYFNTYTLPCFNYYHDLFYVDKVKKIPMNIGELLTPVGLAYWAMDDGGKKNKGFILGTDSYTLSEVELLIKVLKQNFDLDSSIHRSKDNYRIYIKHNSMENFRILVTPYFHESMMYKLAV